MMRLAYIAAAFAIALAHAANSATPAALFGSNTYVFTPHTPLEEIRKIAERIAKQQLDNQFGAERYALLFEPGAYGTEAAPLHLQIGYYTSIAGLGASPRDVVINGTIQVRNRCFNGACLALDNFWRSMSNLTINVADHRGGCDAGEIWAASQAAPVRRLRVTGGDFRLTDVCTKPSHASGGFIADSEFSGSVDNGGQQQFLVRNSAFAGWRNSNWSQVFSGVDGAPAPCTEPGQTCSAYTTLAKSPVTREAPFLYQTRRASYAVFVPAVQKNSVGPSWRTHPTPGVSIPLDRFYIAAPTDDAITLNRALERGQHLLLTPGVYHLSQTLRVRRAGTLILGLGMPSLVPENGVVTMDVSANRGVSINGVIFDAGHELSPVLLRIGDGGAPGKGDAGDPSALHDVFFRIGGAEIASAAVSLVVNSDHVILDHLWAWRADHGTGVGWESNRADTGLVVHGNHVTAYGLFVEHYQKHEVSWYGNDGTVVFFQNEMPYDPPSQARWSEAPGHDGYPAFEIDQAVTTFHGYAMGSYSYFNQGVPIFAAYAFKVPQALAAGSLQNLFTIFLNPKAAGGIRHVVNEQGDASTRANPDVAVWVRSYP